MNCKSLTFVQLGSIQQGGIRHHDRESEYACSLAGNQCQPGNNSHPVCQNLLVNLPLTPVHLLQILPTWCNKTKIGSWNYRQIDSSGTWNPFNFDVVVSCTMEVNMKYEYYLEHLEHAQRMATFWGWDESFVMVGCPCQEGWCMLCKMVLKRRFQASNRNIWRLFHCFIGNVHLYAE